MEIKERIDRANEEVIQRFLDSQPVWVDVRKAIDVVPGMTPALILHSGPPIAWERMCFVQRESVIGAVLFEGLAKTPGEAEKRVAAGEIRLEPCHAHAAVGAMTGVTSASMAVVCVENRPFGTKGFCKVVERRLQFGVRTPEALDNLRWMAEELGPALGQAVRRLGGVELKPIIAQALHMGDECHNRNVAATALLLRTLAPELAEAAGPRRSRRILQYFQEIDQAFLGLAMAAGKSMGDAAHGVRDSSVVTVMARNGVEFGVRVSGLGDRWFTGEAQVIDGAFLPGFSAADATRDIGDSTITETIGLGGMAMANALTASAIAGGKAEDAIRRVRENMEITAGRSRSFTLPVLDFEGTPVGIDVRRVVETGILPVLLTGIASNKPGGGRIGGGVVQPPMEAFVRAVKALAEQVGASS
ncbi:MAG: DUF1116 domain-containing protein [Candidatus Tectomicrobia bacterium]|nr:DUF1116 domain-containing protein [Candidatus Tectomicrobia bacterium]